MHTRILLTLSLLSLTPLAAADTCVASLCVFADAPGEDKLVQSLVAPETCQGSECVVLWRATLGDCVYASEAHGNHPAPAVGTGTFTQSGFTGPYAYVYYSYGVFVATGPCTHPLSP